MQLLICFARTLSMDEDELEMWVNMFQTVSSWIPDFISNLNKLAAKLKKVKDIIKVVRRHCIILNFIFDVTHGCSSKLTAAMRARLISPSLTSAFSKSFFKTMKMTSSQNLAPWTSRDVVSTTLTLLVCSCLAASLQSSTEMKQRKFHHSFDGVKSNVQ